MALVRFSRRPARLAFQPFAGVPAFEEMDTRMRKMMEEVLADNDTPSPIGWMPVVEITETPSSMIITAELPGLDKKDVDVAIEDDLLTISGEKAEEKKEGEDKKYLVWERSYGSFTRSFTLPRGIDGSKISAEFAKGVLRVTMPKTTEAQSKGRKIEVSAK